MTLRGPTQDDVRKLHAESTQILNQQHLITAAAITTFGVVIAWHLPDMEGGAPLDSPFVLHGSFLLLGLLALLFLWSSALTGIVRMYSEYLVMHGQSGWEADWRDYRRRFRPLGHAGVQGVVFMVLGVLTAVFPIYLYGVRALWSRFPSLLVQLLVILLLYEGLVLARGILEWPDLARRARRRWALMQTAEPPLAQASPGPSTGHARPEGQPPPAA